MTIAFLRAIMALLSLNQTSYESYGDMGTYTLRSRNHLECMGLMGRVLLRPVATKKEVAKW